ncbi:MAG: hypothetical protein IKS98_13115 [Lachnospiraceae bacterium]|nr:hypothetical protein [Lachnospiraceae bacterium]
MRDGFLEYLLKSIEEIKDGTWQPSPSPSEVKADEVKPEYVRFTDENGKVFYLKSSDEVIVNGPRVVNARCRIVKADDRNENLFKLYQDMGEKGLVYSGTWDSRMFPYLAKNGLEISPCGEVYSAEQI